MLSITSETYSDNIVRQIEEKHLMLSSNNGPTLKHAVIIEDSRASALAIASEPLECLGTGTTWAEGPVWLNEDESLIFSDIPENRLMRWSAKDGLKVWREHVDYCNGHFCDLAGALLHCSHGQRAIVRTQFGPKGVAGAGGPPAERDCVDELLVDRFQGRRLNSPNDLVVKSDGTIWFTDPPYGILSNREGHAAESEQVANHIFRFDPNDGRKSSLCAVSDWVEEPNGLAFSPDESILYVTDTSNATRTDSSGNHHIVAFDVIGGQALANPRVFATIRPGLPDGIRLDSRGWIFTSSGDSVQIFHPDGTRLARIPVPEKVGNLTFGGVRRNELYITASTSLYRIRLNAIGLGCHDQAHS
jgi:gluconolactonase